MRIPAPQRVSWEVAYARLRAEAREAAALARSGSDSASALEEQRLLYRERLADLYLIYFGELPDTAVPKRRRHGGAGS